MLSPSNGLGKCLWSGGWGNLLPCILCTVVLIEAWLHPQGQGRAGDRPESRLVKEGTEGQEAWGGLVGGRGCGSGRLSRGGGVRSMGFERWKVEMGLLLDRARHVERPYVWRHLWSKNLSMVFWGTQDGTAGISYTHLLLGPNRIYS